MKCQKTATGHFYSLLLFMFFQG